MKNTKLRDSGDGAEVEGDEHLDGVSSSASGTSSHYHRNRSAAAAGSSLESQVGNWPDNWRKERKERRRDDCALTGGHLWFYRLRSKISSIIESTIFTSTIFCSTLFLLYRISSTIIVSTYISSK